MEVPNLRDVVGLIERIYDPEVAPERWLEAVVHAAAPLLDMGGGLHAYGVETGAFGARATEHAVTGDDPATAAARFERWRAHTPPRYQAMVHRLVPCGFGSRLPAHLLGLPHDTVLEPIGEQDVFGVNGLDATGRGCALVAFVARPVASDPSTAVWTRVSAHLAAGARLARRRRAREPIAEEAVLTLDGRLLHAEGEAREAPAREALRRLATDVDRARSVARDDPDQATRLWRALAAGRWSLVDRFERDGRHFLIANPNEAELPVLAPLTRREEQVVGHAALGHADKVIAYELGLSPGTVATLLSRARRKLGVGSRAELVTAWLARQEDR